MIQGTIHSTSWICRMLSKTVRPTHSLHLSRIRIKDKNINGVIDTKIELTTEHIHTRVYFYLWRFCLLLFPASSLLIAAISRFRAAAASIFKLRMRSMQNTILCVAKMIGAGISKMPFQIPPKTKPRIKRRFAVRCDKTKDHFVATRTASYMNQ